MSNYFIKEGLTMHASAHFNPVQKAARLLDLFLADDMRPSLVEAQLDVRAQLPKQAGGFVGILLGDPIVDVAAGEEQP